LHIPAKWVGRRRGWQKTSQEEESLFLPCRLLPRRSFRGPLNRKHGHKEAESVLMNRSGKMFRRCEHQNLRANQTPTRSRLRNACPTPTSSIAWPPMDGGRPTPSLQDHYSERPEKRSKWCIMMSRLDQGFRLASRDPTSNFSRSLLRDTNAAGTMEIPNTWNRPNCYVYCR
jgi:hypothetical protein